MLARAMTDLRQPDDHRKLLERLDSFEQLHLLVLVMGDPHARWTASRLDDLTPGADVRPIVQDLVDAGVLVPGPAGTVSLEPALVASARALLRSYKEDPLPIIRTLTQRSMERLRKATARTFSEAFVLRRKDS
jgi:hypothetical protein